MPGTGKGNISWLPGFSYLLETKWWRPHLLSLRSDKIGKRDVDVVETTLYGRRIDYYFDRITHLNVRQVLHARDWEGKEQAYTSDLFDHSSVAGIMLPSKVSSPDEPGEEKLSFKLND